jgi:hypothetical protein
MENTTPEVAVRPSRRKRNLLILLLVIVLAAAGCTAWYLLYARYYESTDDAYVNGNQVTLTPQIAGKQIQDGITAHHQGTGRFHIITAAQGKRGDRAELGVDRTDGTGRPATAGKEEKHQ